MPIELSSRKSLIAPMLTACLVFTLAAIAQNAEDVEKIKIGSCGNQRSGNDKCNVSNTNLRNITLNGQYHHITAIHTDFSGSKLRNATFEDAELTNANFSGINSVGGSFNSNNLTSADFSLATLREMDFGNDNLTNANLSGAYIENWAEFHFESSKLCNTILPDGSINNRDC